MSSEFQAWDSQEDTLQIKQQKEQTIVIQVQSGVFRGQRTVVLLCASPSSGCVTLLDLFRVLNVEVAGFVPA